MSVHVIVVQLVILVPVCVSIHCYYTARLLQGSMIVKGS